MSARMARTLPGDSLWIVATTPVLAIAVSKDIFHS